MMKLISRFALPMVIIVILYLLISGNLFSMNLLLIVQVLAFLMMPWARHSFQPGQFSIHAEPKEGQVLVSGPYQYIRHPMYASVLTIIWAGIAGHFSPTTLVIGVIVTLVVTIRIMIEEQYLRTHYPDYVHQSRKTKRIIPFVI
jgi:protein-S-isoprenylcysteine O-methyltransferase Ste14